MPPPVPIPVQPLAYSIPWQEHTKPGLITTIGVMCIVVACLSGLVSFFIGIYGFGFYMVSKFSGARTPATPATTSVVTASGPQADEKLPIGDVGVADNTLRSLLSLDGPRVRELDRLMRTHGKAVFPPDEDNDGAPLTAATIRSAVKQHNRATNPSAAAHFTTDAGSVDIYPDRAIFTSADGATTIDTSAARNSESVNNYHSTGTTVVGSGPGQSPTTLTSAQVQQIIKTVKKLAPQPPNSAQLATIRSQLAAPNQQLVTNAGGSPVSLVMPQGPNLMIQFDSGMLTVGRKGEVVSMMSYNTAFTTGMPNFAGIGPPAALLIFEAFLSVVWAIYLLIVGILVMRSSFKSPRLLRVYAWVKIPLALMGGAALGWMIYGFAAAATSAAGAGTTSTGFVAIACWGAVFMALGLAFPISVLIVLRTRTVREFFNSVSPA
jgi:hypothetical protein